MGDPLARLDDAAAALGRGGVIVLPTETVYGLAARPDHPDAVDRIYALKGRPRERVLQVLIPSAQWLQRWSEPSAAVVRLAERYWPGPLTLIVAASERVPASVAGNGTVGVRVPAFDVTLELLRRTGPLAATSANRSGGETPVEIAAIRALFSDGVDVYIDGGLRAGPASTVVDLSGPNPIVRREGAIPASSIEEVLGGRFERG